VLTSLVGGIRFTCDVALWTLTARMMASTKLMSAIPPLLEDILANFVVIPTPAMVKAEVIITSAKIGSGPRRIVAREETSFTAMAALLRLMVERSALIWRLLHSRQVYYLVVTRYT
jgi:hypothetical protein